MLRAWDQQFPGRSESIFAAIRNVSPSQLADASLFDFADLQIDRGSDETAADQPVPIRFANVGVQ